MSVPPESIRVGQCYLMNSGQVRRVLRIMPDSRVQYESRPAHRGQATTWKPGMQDSRSFAAVAERLVPCAWTPETDG